MNPDTSCAESAVEGAWGVVLLGLIIFCALASAWPYVTAWWRRRRAWSPYISPKRSGW